MKNIEEVEKLEILLIKLFESHSLNQEDYNFILKYLAKVKNDFRKIS